MLARSVLPTIAARNRSEAIPFQYSRQRLEREVVVGIIAKVKTSFEATKEFYEAWAIFGASLAAAVVCALVGGMIWVAYHIGSVPACFAFSGFFLVVAGLAKFLIDAKGREARENFNSAKDEVIEDASAVAQPLKIANNVVSGRVGPVAPVVLFVSLLCIAYLMKDQPAQSS